MALIQYRDIVVVGQQAWDIPIGSNCKDLALEFSKHNRVLYVNSPLDRRTKLQQHNTLGVKKRVAVVNGEEDGLEKINDNFYIFYPDVIIESINFIRWSWVFRIFNKINNQRFGKSLQKVLKRLDFKDFILFNDSDMFRSYHLKELIQPKTSVYYSRDNLIYTDYWRRHGKRLEPELIKKSDVCIANSTYLKDYCQRYNANSHYVGQGCDLTLFNPGKVQEIPKEIQYLKKPILGYIGALLAIRLDENILIHLAEQLPGWSIVLVGPEDETFQKSKLHHLPNVFFLGAKKPESLPNYIQGFDICLNPQTVNPLTIGNYPRKIDEYLAMGKPVIATKTQATDIFLDYIYTANTKEEYVQLAQQAMAENNSDLAQKRMLFAQTHTWEKNVEEIYKVIIQTEK